MVLIHDFTPHKTDNDPEWSGWHSIINGDTVLSELMVVHEPFRPDTTATIWSVRTHGEHRNKGYGRANMTHACKALFAAGVEEIQLCAASSARCFYEKLGWHPLRNNSQWMYLRPDDLD